MKMVEELLKKYKDAENAVNNDEKIIAARNLVAHVIRDSSVMDDFSDTDDISFLYAKHDSEEFLSTEECWLNVYKVTRQYGGPEEGGWYYNHLESVHSEESNGELAKVRYQELHQEYSHLKWGDIYSVLGGVHITVMSEKEAKASETKEVPVYD